MCVPSPGWEEFPLDSDKVLSYFLFVSTLHLVGASSCVEDQTSHTIRCHGHWCGLTTKILYRTHPQHTHKSLSSYGALCPDSNTSPVVRACSLRDELQLPRCAKWIGDGGVHHSAGMGSCRIIYWTSPWYLGNKSFVWMQGLAADGSVHGSFSPQHANSMEFFTSSSCGFTPQGLSLTWSGKRVRMGNWWVGFIQLIGGKTAFCSAAPAIWNSLSLSLYLIDSQSDFKSHLKTSLFCAL